MRWLIGVVMLLGVGVMLGCAPKAAQTIPSGEALKEKLAKEGNPTSWTFHAPMEKVHAAIQAQFPDSHWVQDVVNLETEISGNLLEGYVAHWPKHRFKAVSHCRAVLTIRVAGVQEGTQVSVGALHTQVTFMVDRLTYNSPFDSVCCCPLSCFEVCLGGNPHILPDTDVLRMEARDATFPVPSNTVAEYEMLRKIGKELGEPGMPEMRLPKIEVVP